MDQVNKYQPGVCNIGPDEIEIRRRNGLGGVLVALAWSILGGVLNFPVLLMLLVFFPAFIGAIGLFQVYFKFCAYFGLSSIFNFSSSSAKKETVLEAKAKELDTRQAWKIISYSLGAALLYTLITAFLL